MVQLHVIVKTPVVYVLLASTLLAYVASLVTKKDKTRQEKGSCWFVRILGGLQL